MSAHTLQDDRKCVTVIFNPKSGQDDPDERRAAISDALAAHGYTCQYFVTTPKQGARHFAEEALRQGIDLLAVSGGDGTVVEAMAALIGTDVPIAVFPAGTGNLLSVNLGISKDPAEAADAALFGQRHKLDLATIACGDGEPKHFAIIAGAGYDARVIAEADRDAKDKLGVLAYVWAALSNLGHRSVRVSVQLDNAARPLRRRVQSVMIANMGSLQGGLQLIPDAEPNDGILDVALLKANSLGDWVRLVGNSVLRRQPTRDTIEYHQARRISVSFKRAQPVQYDGEEGETTRTITIEVLPSAVTVMVPQAVLNESAS